MEYQKLRVEGWEYWVPFADQVGISSGSNVAFVGIDSGSNVAFVARKALPQLQKFASGLRKTTEGHFLLTIEDEEWQFIPGDSLGKWALVVGKDGVDVLRKFFGQVAGRASLQKHFDWTGSASLSNVLLRNASGVETRLTVSISPDNKNHYINLDRLKDILSIMTGPTPTLDFSDATMSENRVSFDVYLPQQWGEIVGSKTEAAMPPLSELTQLTEDTCPFCLGGLAKNETVAPACCSRQLHKSCLEEYVSREATHCFWCRDSWNPKGD